jgi:hypothetical protein
MPSRYQCIPLLDLQGSRFMHIILVYDVSYFITNHLKTHYLKNKIFINSNVVLKLLVPSYYIVGAACRRGHTLLVAIKMGSVISMMHSQEIRIEAKESIKKKI